MIKYHFYKCGKHPELPGVRFYDYSTGLTAFLSPQSLRFYLGYLTPDEAETKINDSADKGERRFHLNFR